MGSLIKKCLCAMLCVTGLPALAADEATLKQSIQSLFTVIDGKPLKYNLERTLSRAVIQERVQDAVLTLDPEFLSQLDQTGLTFVVAHEYAHVYLGHQAKLGKLAMELSGKPSPDSAFDWMEMRPASMGPLHAMNRAHELEADQIATDWLKALGMNACDDNVLSSIDNGGLVFMVVPSHPGFHERRRVICPNSGKPDPARLFKQAAGQSGG